MRHGGRRGKSSVEFRVRRASLRDLENLVHQRRGMWEDMGVTDPKALGDADSAYASWVRSRIANRDIIGWIVKNTEGVVAGGGCLWLRPSQPRPNYEGLVEPYLFSMFTEQRFRRKGVASIIVREAIKWCQRNSYGRISLHANKKGRRLYSRLGFTRTWEMRLEVGKTASIVRR
jgi:GNAT superfamily N-acetyltransferase